MTPARSAYLARWHTLLSVYQQVVYVAAHYGGMHAESAWEQFRAGILDVLHWADLISAASLRRQATGRHTVLPSGADSTIPQIASANQWYVEHLLSAEAEIEQQADSTVDREIKYLSHRPTAQMTMAMPAWRLERIQRDAAGLVAMAAEQVQMRDPVISDAFTHAIYYSRDDQRVRPTHRAMHGFAACRSWEHWPIVVPPCSWNCRCFTRFVARHEAIDKGWLSKSGRILMQVRWPNSVSKLNFDRGEFPDWKLPRPWAFPEIARPAKKIA